ncbi:MAG TPA: hypothetical protein DCS93_40670 [Microscillaceae bacterium]|nr:hypothetical protein [Microscillaceae bacterium]
MQKIFENEFVSTYFDTHTQMAKNIWKEQSQYLTDIQFKDLFTHLQPTIFSYAVTRLMIDVRLFKFVIEPDLQEWTTEYVIDNYAKNGIAKIATILPSSIFERVSLQQTFNENITEKGLQRKQFDDEEQAKTWLLA